MNNYRLIIFDVDGPLANPDSGSLLPDAAAYFTNLAAQGDPAPLIALAANQGGVGLRRWMEKNGFGEPHKYPTQQQAEAHIHGVAQHIARLYRPPAVYLSFAYQSKSGEWAPAPQAARGDPRWRRDWRKPAPGMLLQAMADAGVTADETLMVSDDPSGQAAAAAAGCDFLWSAQLFPQRTTQTQARDLPPKKVVAWKTWLILISAGLLLACCGCGLLQAILTGLSRA